MYYLSLQIYSQERKMDKLLDRDDSLVGRCLEGILHLVRAWPMQDGSSPWLLLEALRAPFDDPGWALWVRCQCLRLNSSLYRRLWPQANLYDVDVAAAGVLPHNIW